MMYHRLVMWSGEPSVMEALCKDDYLKRLAGVRDVCSTPLTFSL